MQYDTINSADIANERFLLGVRFRRVLVQSKDSDKAEQKKSCETHETPKTQIVKRFLSQ